MKLLSSILCVLSIKIVTSIILDCYQSDDAGDELTCRSNQIVNSSDMIVEDISNYRNRNLTTFKIKDDNVYFIPKNIANFFPLIPEFIVISNNLLQVSKHDIEPFKNLRNLSLIPTSKIKSLDADLFDFDNEISSFVLYSGVLESIHPNLMKSLPRLKECHILGGCTFSVLNIDLDTEVFWDGALSQCPYPGTVYCVYQMKTVENEKTHYSCVVEKTVKITSSSDVKLSDIYGIHKFNKSDSDILEIDVTFKETNDFPTFLALKFPNLKIVRISSFIEYLKVNDFKLILDLEELNLAYNNVHTIFSDAFKFNKKLKKINLEGNKLAEIGIGAFWMLPQLTSLAMDGRPCAKIQENKREKIVKFFNNLKKTECITQDALYCKFKKSTVNFLGNVYTCIGINNEDDILNQFIELKTIAFGDHIERFSHDAVEAVKIQNYKIRGTFEFNFHGEFPNLKYIQIVNSDVSSIDKVLFNSLKHLSIVDFSHNKIENIKPNIFNDNFNLVSVNFEGNRLKKIPSNVFTHNLNLDFVNLLENICTDIQAVGKTEIDKIKIHLRNNCN